MPSSAIRWLLSGQSLLVIWKIPLIVGTILTLINQGGRLMGFAGVPLPIAIVCNFAIPYIVSSLGHRAAAVHETESERVTQQGTELPKTPETPQTASLAEALRLSPDVSVTTEGPSDDQPPEAPFAWIVNSNALGVAFLDRSRGFETTFLSRHAQRRLADRSLLGLTAEELIGNPATAIAPIEELTPAALADPSTYPKKVSASVAGHHVQLALSAVIDEDGTFLGAMMTFDDVTRFVEEQQRVLEFQREIADHISNVRSVGSKAEDGVSEVKESLRRVDGHGASIATSLESLNGLNKQTRMLSLNASIEAQRAGKAGRPFVVVADEVRQLSIRTNEVVEHLASALQTIESDTEHGTESGERLVDSVSELNELLSQIDRAVSDSVDHPTFA